MGRYMIYVHIHTYVHAAMGVVWDTGPRVSLGSPGGHNALCSCLSSHGVLLLQRLDNEDAVISLNGTSTCPKLLKKHQAIDLVFWQVCARLSLVPPPTTTVPVPHTVGV